MLEHLQYVPFVFDRLFAGRSVICSVGVRYRTATVRYPVRCRVNYRTPSTLPNDYRTFGERVTERLQKVRALNEMYEANLDRKAGGRISSLSKNCIVSCEISAEMPNHDRSYTETELIVINIDAFSSAKLQPTTGAASNNRPVMWSMGGGTRNHSFRRRK